MLTEFFPFLPSIQPLAIAGTGLWAIGLYLGFYPLSQWITEQLNRWFNFAERSLYLSAEEFEKTRSNREAQNAFWASIFSVLPFLLVGGGLYYLLVIGLSQTWSISLGMMAMIGGGIYELGRRDGQSS
uniref:Uncharacterized protein n=1 Tax=Cyanothece sp. (strain PCC 7425 / ATCC 29141) TaxID=395961 RepID=B8HLP1_CYAP4